MAVKYTYNEQNKVWKTRVWDGTYRNGSKHYIDIRSKKSSKDLEQKVNEFKQGLANQTVVASNSILFIDYARQWLTKYKQSVRLNTKANYTRIIEGKFKRVENVQLSDLRRDHWYIITENENYAVCEKTMQVYRQVIKAAVMDQLLPKSAYDTLLTGIALPAKPKSSKRALTEAEVNAVKNAELSDMDKAFLWIIYGCGLRRGEALALRIDDVINGYVDVNKVLVYDGDHPVIEEGIAKTQNSIRKVQMPDFVNDYIKYYVTKCNNYLFHGQRTENLTRTGYRRMWERISNAIYKEVGSDTGLTAHIFRHNYTSRLMSQVPENISFTTACAMIGDDPATLMKIYMHSIQEKEDKAKALNSVF